jgi:hypothetical protein
MNKEKNIHFSLDQFEKIEDIIFIDEPILTHYKRNDKHFLMYLVDTLEKSDMFLLLEVEENQIYSYLTNQTSLRDVICLNENICYIIEQDFHGKTIDLSVTESSLINKDYLPLDNSFLDYKPLENSYYYKFINDLSYKGYLTDLRKTAFYIKISSNGGQTYSDTIGFNELAGNLIPSISSSFKNFLKADFFKMFREKSSDLKKTTSIFTKLLPQLDYRMVDLNFSSFEIGLSVDRVMKKTIEDRDIREWATEVGYKYKELVLESGYDNETVDKILNFYSEDDRRKIFKPIFDLVENPDYNLQVKNSKKERYTTIKLNNSKIKERITPEIKKIKKEDSKDLQLIQITTVIDKNSKKSTVKLENSLFNSAESTEFMLTNKHFEKQGYELDFEISIPTKISTEANNVNILAVYNHVSFKSIMHSANIDEGVNNLTKKIYEYICNRE